MTTQRAACRGRRGRDRRPRRARALLQSIVDIARAIFHAKAASVLLYDEEADELVFEAVSGEGEQSLVGTRMPSGTGIAGWVLTTRQPLVVNDTAGPALRARRRRSDRLRAEEPDVRPAAARGPGARRASTCSTAAAAGRSARGDRPARQFANQAALALLQLQRARRVRGCWPASTTRSRQLPRLAEALAHATPDAAQSSRLALLEALTEVLGSRRT